MRAAEDFGFHPDVLILDLRMLNGNGAALPTSLTE
jgi:hypothetical protein